MVLSNAAASKDASDLEVALVGQRHMGQAKALSFVMVVGCSMVVVEPVHFVKVQVC